MPSNGPGATGRINMCCYLGQNAAESSAHTPGEIVLDKAADLTDLAMDVDRFSQRAGSCISVLVLELYLGVGSSFMGSDRTMRVSGTATAGCSAEDC